jgi:hypothetical protein
MVRVKFGKIDGTTIRTEGRTDDAASLENAQ